LTMAPVLPAVLSRRATPCATWKVPLRLTVSTRAQSASVISSGSANSRMPAEFTSTSGPQPSASSTESKASTAAASVTSSASPRPPSCAATARAASPSRSARITRAPCDASSAADAAPMPLAPPVTRAVRPENAPPLTAVPASCRRRTGWSRR